MMTRRVAWVTGDTNWDDHDSIRTALNWLQDQPGGILITGGARGADMIANAYADDVYAHSVYVPYFGPGGRGGGPMRNQVIAEIASALQDTGHDVAVFAFGDDNGTLDSIRQAENHGLTVTRIQ
jgi:hypothetical protein